ncbi:MAG: hypothetical protein JWN07_3525 [Hyphomicrobiales bacterium]|nr:hypothetical protein [Hyphomicrobiales bacterium]
MALACSAKDGKATECPFGGSGHQIGRHCEWISPEATCKARPSPTPRSRRRLGPGLLRSARNDDPASTAELQPHRRHCERSEAIQRPRVRPDCRLRCAHGGDSGLEFQPIRTCCAPAPASTSDATKKGPPLVETGLRLSAQVRPLSGAASRSATSAPECRWRAAGPARCWWTPPPPRPRLRNRRAGRCPHGTARGRRSTRR